MGGARRLFWSGIALTALLALVAVASRAHRPGGGSGARPGHVPGLLADYASTLALILIPIGAVLIIWGMTQKRRRAALEGRTNWRRTLVSLAVFSLLLGAGVYFTDRHGGLDLALWRWSDHSVPAPTTPVVRGHLPRKAKQAKPVPQHQPRFRWLPALVVGSLVLGLAISIGATALRRRREGGAWDEEAALAAALDKVLADTLDDLRAERNPRRAVICAYARMEKTLAAYGVARDQSEAPLEYLARVLESLTVSAYSVRRLTQLFQRAKFSPHEIDSGMKDDAIEALAGLRAELEERREAA